LGALVFEFGERLTGKQKGDSDLKHKRRCESFPQTCNFKMQKIEKMKNWKFPKISKIEKMNTQNMFLPHLS
jgi:hypothetical protein